MLEPVPRLPRLARRLVLLAVALLGLRTIPVTWCAREAEALWADELALHDALARGVEQGQLHARAREAFMTGSDRFDGEWMFGTHLMAALGHAQLARAHPERLAAALPIIDAHIEAMLDPEVRAFDREAWGHDPLDELGSPRAHAAYLGYLGLAISLRRTLAPGSPHAALGDRIAAHLHAALARSELGLLQTYPGEVYPVDNAAAIATLSLHQRATGADHSEVLAAWDHALPRWLDPSTGLLVQAVSPATAAIVDGPRGSGTGLAAYFLSFHRASQSRALYEASREHLRRDLLGFGAMREYPPGRDGPGDIDSGPVLLGVSISATGFALAGSRIHGDAEAFTALWATTALFGAPVDRDHTRRFALGGPLGDAMMLALLTARPSADWEALP